jgi:hypothetical protein
MELFLNIPGQPDNEKNMYTPGSGTPKKTLLDLPEHEKLAEAG